MPSEKLNALLDDLSVLISSEILFNDAKRASFDMISEWYSDKGYINSTWIELLDLKKWIPIPDGSPRKGDVPVEGDETDSDMDEDEDEDEDEDSSSGDDESEDAGEDYYQASLAKGHSLVINAVDTAHVLAVAAASGLGNFEPRDLVSVLAQYATNGKVTNKGFLAFLDELPTDHLDNEVRNKVYKDLFSIFNIFERHLYTGGNSSRGAEFRPLAVGLTMLCKGSKSLKLEIGFRVFEESQDNGQITEESLFSFLASYLLVLTALEIIEDSSVAIDTAITLSQVIAEMLNNKITFPSFGKWYNVEGYNYAPWIELLNLEKWEKITGFKTGQDDVYQYYSNEEPLYEEEVNDGTSEDAMSEGQGDAFSIVLNSQSFERKISVSKECASKVFHFTRYFGSKESSIAQLVPELSVVSKDGLISKRDFLSTLRELGFNIKMALHADDVTFADMLFDAFDRANSGYCDIDELVTGVVMMDHQGTKSEKLVYAFDFIDRERIGVLSKREIWKFFRSFLISVVLLSCPDLRPSDYLHILVDESAVWVVESILSYVAKGSQSTPSEVSFDDIAEWYSHTGCSNSAWIELLDFSKWIYLSS